MAERDGHRPLALCHGTQAEAPTPRHNFTYAIDPDPQPTAVRRARVRQHSSVGTVEAEKNLRSLSPTVSRYITIPPALLSCFHCHLLPSSPLTLRRIAFPAHLVRDHFVIAHRHPTFARGTIYSHISFSQQHTTASPRSHHEGNNRTPPDLPPLSAPNQCSGNHRTARSRDHPRPPPIRPRPRRPQWPSHHSCDQQIRLPYLPCIRPQSRRTRTYQRTSHRAETRRNKHTIHVPHWLGGPYLRWEDDS